MIENIKLSKISSPHVRDKSTIGQIMRDVLIALIPATLVAILAFGWYMLVLALVGLIGGSLIDVFVMKVLRRKKDYVFDGSGAVTGLLLALNIPASFPMFLFIIGLLFALFVGKHVFGGLGHNFLNPALIGRVFLLISFPLQMTTWVKPAWLHFTRASYDLQTTATPLALLKENGIIQAHERFNAFIGNIPGSAGEISAIALIIGGAYLLLRHVITWHIPVSYVGTVAGISAIFWLVNPGKYGDPIFHVVSGGLLLGAIFMATDMVTSPETPKGMVIFGVGCGALTMLIRYFGGYPEGVSFSILIMNALVPFIEKVSHPRRLGEVKSRA